MIERDAIVVAGAARTPVGSFGGSLKDVHPADLGALAISEALKRSGIEGGTVDDVIVGSVGQYAENAFLARMAAMRAGVPASANAYTVNRLCGSGLQAIHSGVQAIRSGEAEVVAAAGAENMNQFPYYVRKGRFGYRFGHDRLEDGLTMALTDPFGQYAMGVTAEIVAERFGVSREEQDRFALESQRKAVRALDAGVFAEEIVPVPLPGAKRGPAWFEADESPRRETSLEKLASLRPAFRDGGTVTAGNSSTINDGAAAVVLARGARAEELGAMPIAYVRGQALSGVDPEIMGVAPAPAIRKLLTKTGVELDEIGLFEINEAFAAQAVAVIRELDLDPAKVNVNGGAIALGHPIGATGCILTVKLLYEMRRRKVRYGIVSLCIGGGQGIAALFELCPGTGAE